MSESQTALIFNLKFANINFPCAHKWSRMEKFGPFPWTEKFFFFHFFFFHFFQDNSKARRTVLIQKWRIGFQDNKKLSLLLIFNGNI